MNRPSGGLASGWGLLILSFKLQIPNTKIMATPKKNKTKTASPAVKTPKDETPKDETPKDETPKDYDRSQLVTPMMACGATPIPASIPAVLPAAEPAKEGAGTDGE